MVHDEALPFVSVGTVQEIETIGADLSPTLTCEIEYIRADFCHAKVIIPRHLVDMLYHEAARSQQRSTQTYGFQIGDVPLEYIKQNFKENLVEHLKELLLKYGVIGFLYEYIRTQKLVVAGEPRLHAMHVEPGQDACFTFELTLFPELSIYEWKYFPFKAPKRKNYKDLDRQVESFMNEELMRLQNHRKNALSVGDWANFTITLLDANGKPLWGNFKQNYWFKLNEDETESPLRTLFLERELGDKFDSDHKTLQEYFSHTLDTHYMFRVEITNMLPHNYFCFDHFKKTFRIKTNKDMHKKLIEVFSYRNDISQRHAMVEEAFSTLLSKHRFVIPNYLILRQQKILVESIQHSPDYNVYRVQKNFQEHIRKLAEKQCMETIFIDKLAYHENLTVSDDDIKGYLNLSNRPRMKEFIYFELPSSKIQGQEVPIATEELKRTCLREKAINYVIYHLTKQ